MKRFSISLFLFKRKKYLQSEILATLIEIKMIIFYLNGLDLYGRCENVLYSNLPKWLYVTMAPMKYFPFSCRFSYVVISDAANNPLQISTRDSILTVRFCLMSLQSRWYKNESNESNDTNKDFEIRDLRDLFPYTIKLQRQTCFSTPAKKATHYVEKQPVLYNF